jgi:nucleoside-diphosphate-sugar epimerase
MRDTFADTARARTDLGFAPTTTLEQGLRAQRDWLAEIGA